MAITEAFAGGGIALMGMSAVGVGAVMRLLMEAKAAGAAEKAIAQAGSEAEAATQAAGAAEVGNVLGGAKPVTMVSVTGEATQVTEWTRVGRWMSPQELTKMKQSGLIQWNEKGLHRFANPAGSEAFKAAPKGDIYVEYDVPSVLITGYSAETGLIYGPGSLQAKSPKYGNYTDVPFQELVVRG